MIEEKINKKDQLEDEKFLILRSQADPEEFRPLYQKYFKQIFLFILHRVGDRQLAADVASQVFLKALLNIKKFQIRALPFSAWLFRIALNECHDFFRKNSRHRIVTIEEEHVEELYEQFTSDSGLEDLHEQLPSILQKLPEADLQLIELRFFEQRSFKEVGDILGITENYAKVKVYRTLEKMKSHFLKR